MVVRTWQREKQHVCWSIYLILDKSKFCVSLPHRHSTTVSLEIRHLQSGNGNQSLRASWLNLFGGVGVGVGHSLLGDSSQVEWDTMQARVLPLGGLKHANQSNVWSLKYLPTRTWRSDADLGVCVKIMFKPIDTRRVFFSPVSKSPRLNFVRKRPGGVLPEDLGGGVRQASGNPYPISDQNL